MLESNTEESNMEEIESIYEFNVNEVNMHKPSENSEFRNIKKDLFMYDILIRTNRTTHYLDQMKLIDMFKSKENNYIVFRFINMNKYCRQDFRKFSDNYTQFSLDLDSLILCITFYAYFIIGDESSKEIIESIKYDITTCDNVYKFMCYLYRRFGNSFQQQ
jgi:hypothetical protein